ncbi:hypothetical protein [Streptomyces sp. NPDC059072]|uniref:hypothetical protein n=1 Tax=Streptomyces sp. NPDC059072 TaxID=3346715 RepID=UPI0036977FCD
MAEVLLDHPRRGVLAGDGFGADVLDAAGVVDTAGSVVGEAEDPQVEPEFAPQAALVVDELEVDGLVDARLEAALDPALAGVRLRMGGALRAQILLRLADCGRGVRTDERNRFCVDWAGCSEASCKRLRRFP